MTKEESLIVMEKDNGRCDNVKCQDCAFMYCHTKILACGIHISKRRKLMEDIRMTLLEDLSEQ